MIGAEKVPDSKTPCRFYTMGIKQFEKIARIIPKVEKRLKKSGSTFVL